LSAEDTIVRVVLLVITTLLMVSLGLTLGQVVRYEVRQRWARRRYKASAVPPPFDKRRELKEQEDGRPDDSQ
jgi:hypothetical protein